MLAGLNRKAVDNYSHALIFVRECYKTQKMCDQAVNDYFSAIQFVPDSYITVI